MNKISLENINNYGYNILNTPYSEVHAILNGNASEIQSKILSNRLYKNNIECTKENVEKYYYNFLNITKDMNKLKDLNKAVELISKHILNNDYIILVVDYDSDGINSGAVLYLTFLKIFKIPEDKFKIFVNHRKLGNGFNKTLTKQILDHHEVKPVALLICADHGSSDNESFLKFKNVGINLVITDHHEIPVDNYPAAADVFINNQRPDSEYHKDVSGCFIAFITMVATYIKLYGENDLSVFNIVLPHVAVSTVTDVMSMSNPVNRYIVKSGINEMNSFRSIKWYAIKKTLGIPGKYNYKNIGFKVGPLINTANRVDNEYLAFKLLIAENIEEATELSDVLNKLSKFRKDAQKKVLKEVKQSMLSDTNKYSIVTTIYTDLAIHGIIAANIGSSKNLPTVCFLDNDTNNIDNPLMGSCRGIVDGVDVLEIFHSIKKENPDVILKYGGHTAAAGCAVSRIHMEEFKTLFDKYAKEQILKLGADTHIEIDSFVPDNKITFSLAKAVDICGPYGKNWAEPVFLSKLIICRVFIMGTMAKLMFRTTDGREISAMHFFNKKGEITIENIKEKLTSGSEVYVAFNISIDSYLNNYNLGMTIIDIKLIYDNNRYKTYRR